MLRRNTNTEPFMHMKYTTPAVCIALSSLLSAGCTTEAWYESMRRGAENECRKQPASTADDCLSRLNKQTYQDYEKERSGSR